MDDLSFGNFSDGIHDITLEICDDKGNCVEETRSIELSNQPPVIIVTTDPELSPWGELISPITKPIGFSLNGTYDPEGDTLTCSWNWLEKAKKFQIAQTALEIYYLQMKQSLTSI